MVLVSVNENPTITNQEIVTSVSDHDHPHEETDGIINFDLKDS